MEGPLGGEGINYVATRLLKGLFGNVEHVKLVPRLFGKASVSCHCLTRRGEKE